MAQEQPHPSTIMVQHLLLHVTLFRVSGEAAIPPLPKQLAAAVHKKEVYEELIKAKTQVNNFHKFVSSSPKTSFVQENNHSCMFIVREQLMSQGLSPAAIEIIMSSWRQGTKSQYQSSLLKYFDFCVDGKIDFFVPSVPPSN